MGDLFQDMSFPNMPVPDDGGELAAAMGDLGAAESICIYIERERERKKERERESVCVCVREREREREREKEGYRARRPLECVL